MIFIKYDEYGNISQTQNITESIGQNSLKANTLYIAFPNVVKSYISMIKEYKCYITFERSDGIKISDLPCTPVSKTIDGIEYFGYLYSFSSKQVTACAGSLIVSPRLFSINSDGDETIAVIGANQTLSVSPSVVESEVVSNLSEAEKNALVDMIQNQHIMWLEKKYNNYSAIEVFTSLLENSMSDGIYVSFDRKRLFIYEHTTESICFGEFVKNGIVKNETGIYKYDNEENFEYIKIDDLKTGNLSDLPFTANSIVEALNKIIDGTELVGNAISADYAETSNNTYRDSEDNLIATYYASKHALSQANKEIANLKEALYGYVLDSTDVEIEKDIPYTTTIRNNTYNLVDNVYGLVKEVKGNTIKSLNLFGNITSFSYNNYSDTYACDVIGGKTYGIKVFNSTYTGEFVVFTYDGDKWTLLGNYSLTNGVKITLDNNVKKIGFNGVDFKRYFMVMENDIPTNYEPYFEGLKSVEFNGLKISGMNLFNNNGNISLMNRGLIIGKKYTLSLPAYYNIKISVTSDDISGSADCLASRDNTKTLTFTWNENKNWNLYVWTTDWVRVSIDTVDIMLNYGDTALPYKPYKEPISLLPYPTTLKGVGSAKDKIVITKNTDDDYYTATKITNVGEVDLGSLNWTYVNDGTYPLFISQKIDTKTLYENHEFNGIMSKYESTKYSYSGNAYKGMSKNGTFTIRANQQDIMIQDYSFTDATSFKTSLSGVMFQYELATPTTEVLSTTLTDSDVMPLLELGGTVEIVGESEVKGSTIIEMVYRLSGINPTTTTEVLENEQ